MEIYYGDKYTYICCIYIYIYIYIYITYKCYKCILVTIVYFHHVVIIMTIKDLIITSHFVIADELCNKSLSHFVIKLFCRTL